MKGRPAGLRFHDLRHYFASLLIAAGLDGKVVQTRLRHASAVTTLNTTATCSRTKTSPHGRRSLLLSLPVRTLCGLRGQLLPSDYAC